jgi:hypothetical protein
MNIFHVKVGAYQQTDTTTAAVSVPVAVPDLAEVRKLANQLHATGQEYHDVVWGWPVQYDPELSESAAEFQVPDGEGGYKTEIRPFWSPASFTIGESGIWLFSLLWEHGRDEAPIEYLDDRNIVASVAHLS